MDLNEQGSQRRRRGKDLEDALLSATWEEIVASGYSALTFEAVAQRAGTSRSVLYRRWEAKADLVRAAVTRMLRTEAPALPNTGTLRGDLRALLKLSNERNLPGNALLFSYLGGYFRETGTNPRDLRELMLADRRNGLDALFERAIARGEIDETQLTPRRRSLAVDLFRHEAIMTLAPVPDDVIDQILDDVVMPLLRPT